MLGNPLGVSVKGFLDDNQAIDGAVGLSFLGGERMQIHSTYLWHFEVVKTDALEMPFYTGVGPAIDFQENPKSSQTTFLYVRAPIGLAFYITELEEKDVPLDLFIESAVLLGGGVQIDLNLGARYYF
jgi:hypothetical protein